MVVSESELLVIVNKKSLSHYTHYKSVWGSEKLCSNLEAGGLEPKTFQTQVHFFNH